MTAYIRAHSYLPIEIGMRANGILPTKLTSMRQPRRIRELDKMSVLPFMIEVEKKMIQPIVTIHSVFSGK